MAATRLKVQFYGLHSIPVVVKDGSQGLHVLASVNLFKFHFNAQMLHF